MYYFHINFGKIQLKTIFFFISLAINHFSIDLCILSVNILFKIINNIIIKLLAMVGDLFTFLIIIIFKLINYIFTVKYFIDGNLTTLIL